MNNISPQKAHDFIFEPDPQTEVPGYTTQDKRVEAVAIPSLYSKPEYHELSKVVESNEENEKIMNSILEVETWSYESINKAIKILETGVQSLEDIPTEFLTLPRGLKADRLSFVMSVGTLFLRAINLGSHRLAVACRAKILEQSREVLQDFRTTYDSQHADSLSSSYAKELQTILEKLKSWESKIREEEEVLDTVKFESNTEILAYFLQVVSLTLESLPVEPFKHAGIILKGLNGLFRGLDLVATGVELHTSRKEKNTISVWADSYATDLSNARFYMKEVRQHYKNAFDQETQQLLEKAIKDHSISIKVFGDYFDKWKIFEKLEKGSRTHSLFESFNNLSRSDRSLLEMEEIRNDFIQEFRKWVEDSETVNEVFTKWYLTQPKKKLGKAYFHKKNESSIEKEVDRPRVWQHYKSAFIRETQPLLWNAMQDHTISIKAFKSYFKKWKIFEKLEKGSQTYSLFESFNNLSRSDSSSAEIEEIRKDFIQKFHEWVEDSDTMDEQFTKWYLLKPTKELRIAYLDHQHTLEHITKNILQDMVKQKHQIERSFSQFKFNVAAINCTSSTVALATAIALGTLGIVTIPFGGAGLLLIAISVGIACLDIGLLGATYYYEGQKKPHITKALTFTFQARLMWARLQASIRTYWHKVNERKYSKAFFQLQSNQDNRARQIAHEKAKQNSEQSKANALFWTERVQSYEKELLEKSWQDFIERGLQIQGKTLSIDFLDRLNEAFLESDFEYFSNHMKEFLKKQLGIDEGAFEEVKKNPKILKKLLLNFFTLDHVSLVSFIRNQEERMKKKENPSPLSPKSDLDAVI